MLCGLHGLALVAVEPGRRVVHRVVQPELVERIAQVVVGVDVLAAVGPAVAAHQMAQAVQEPSGPAAVDHVFHVAPVAHQHPDQRGQVGGGPVARDVTFGKTDVARAQRRGAHVPVLQRHHGVGQFAVAEALGITVGQLHRQRAMADPLQQSQDTASCGRRAVGQGERGGGQGVHGRVGFQVNRGKGRWLYLWTLRAFGGSPIRPVALACGGTEPA